MISYHEALSRCLEAARQGGDLEGVIATLPSRYAERLRHDAELTRAVRDFAATMPPPSADAERAAAARLRSELAAARNAGFGPPPGGWFGGLRLPRYTIAAVSIAVLLIAGSFLLPGSDDGGVEAATLEGVVVASGAGNLTVQTLDTLEEVSVPVDAQVSDESGATLDPAALEVGQVVVIRGNREPGGLVRAANVERRSNGLPGWCTDDAPRCRQLAQNLETARERCQAEPAACRGIGERVNELIDHVGEVVRLEDLKLRCREAGREVCQDFATFCREHANVCIQPGPPAPVNRLEEARERLRYLSDLCDNRDTAACRQIAQVCAAHPVLCPANEAPTPPRSRPATDAPSRPGPGVTPAGEQRNVR